MNKLLDDNIEIILKKFHRFNYLCKFGSTCKFFNIHSKKILNFHFNRMNFVLNNNLNNDNLNNDNLNNDNIHIYKLVSKYLYNYKILNIKYYNFIKNIELDNFIKIIILFNENCSTKRNDLFITNVTNVLDFFSKKQDDFIPFLIIYIQTGYSLHFEYNNLKNQYLLVLNNPFNKITLKKNINYNEILLLMKFSKNSLMSYIYKNYLNKFFN